LHIAKFIISLGLTEYGYISRRSNARMPNNYCLKEGIMKKGIPPKRRADEVEVNLMIMGLRKISL
jgi:hypothetical protein